MQHNTNKMSLQEEKQEEEEQQLKQALDNELELRHELIQTQSRLKEDITSDYILAKLSEEEKDAIIEISNTAYMIKRNIKAIQNKARKYNWNNQKKQWTKTPLNTQEKTEIKNTANTMFDMYMTRTQVATILSRNKKDNHLIRLTLGQTQDAEETEITGKDKKLDDIKTQIKELAKGKGQ